VEIVADSPAPACSHLNRESEIHGFQSLGSDPSVPRARETPHARAAPFRAFGSRATRRKAEAREPVRGRINHGTVANHYCYQCKNFAADLLQIAFETIF
jgi:hypothetical protein